MSPALVLTMKDMSTYMRKASLELGGGKELPVVICSGKMTVCVVPNRVTLQSPLPSQGLPHSFAIMTGSRDLQLRAC